jgi:1,4-dihydroxy-2-naphthoate octaprenyltransferase
VTALPTGPSAPPAPGGLRRWVVGARPRTLASAVSPVCVGTAIGRWSTGADVFWWRAAGALAVALAIQIGTNYANDYADGVRGTDETRVGPLRLVASGLASPRAVAFAAVASFGVAGVVGLALAAATTWWLLLVGAASVAAGWLYTGGPRPYGYLGLGEPFVFVFFGLVATMGSAYLQVGRVTLVSFVAALPVGFVTTALLEANNLRDREGDAAAGKRTLAVRLGATRAPWLYAGAIGAAALGIGGLATWRPIALIALGALLLAIAPVRLVLGGAEGKGLLPVLAATGRIQIAMGALLVVGILV